jgi:hypothetical protein
MASQFQDNPVLKTDTPDVSPASVAPTGSDDGLAWLEGLAEKHGARPEELITPREARTENPPSWIDNLGQGDTEIAEGWRPVPDEMGDSSGPGDAATADQSASGSGASLDWLTGLAVGSAFAEMEKPGETENTSFPGEPAPPQVSPLPTAQTLPEWLADKPIAPTSVPPQTAREPSGEYESGLELPDWLSDLDGSKRAAPAEEAHPGEVPGWLPPGTEQPEPLRQSPSWRPLTADAVPGENPVAPVPEHAPTRAEAAPLRSTPEVPPARQAPSAKAKPTPHTASSDASSLETAKAEMARGNIAAALDIYGQLIRKGKSLSEIIRELRDSLYRYPVEVSIWQALGDAYMRDNRLQEALDAYTKAEELLR